MRLIDGKAIAKKIEEKIEKSKRGGGLAAILIGDNPESRLYVALKEKAVARVGINFEKIIYPKNVSETAILKKIKELNSRQDITGIIVQLPLPKNLNTDKIIGAIDPRKDVDGFHPENLNKFKRGKFPFYPPVLGAVLEILKNIKSPLPPFLKGGLRKGLPVVLVSNSKIFPIPFQAYFGKNLTICKFKDIKKYLPSADIIITAVGKKHYLKSGLVKNDVIIIDVGIVREGKKIFGDADPVSLAEKRGWLTPVPGGVGPVTVACLLKNTTK